MDIDTLANCIHNIAIEWQESCQWAQPTPKRAIEFMVTEAGEALDAAIESLDEGYVRNNQDRHDGSLASVDKEVADVVIMALRYFALRQVSAEDVIIAKISRMDEKRGCTSSKKFFRQRR